MNRRLWLVMAGGGVVAVASLVCLPFACRPADPLPEIPPPSEPARIHFSRLPPLVYTRGEYVGREVRTAFYRLPAPTADPLVYLFHPGEPVEVNPPTYRLHFGTPPVFADAPFVVVGTVDGIDTDLVRRLNGVPGVLVLRGCRALPSGH